MRLGSFFPDEALKEFIKRAEDQRLLSSFIASEGVASTCNETVTLLKELQGKGPSSSSKGGPSNWRGTSSGRGNARGRGSGSSSAGKQEGASLFFKGKRGGRGRGNNSQKRKSGGSGPSFNDAKRQKSSSF